ncbi:S-layer homology domain-containing protein [Paenibacillus graminis]|uniref:S-layer homology domain-containing protein n=1 Tax=Paenibacillus graminis TaxID=189425 RepID=UPI002DB888E5|nr:S-layer homology domain-containing protein [Paenibacillus graminis]MEC0170012.1 S-layer homology domain-containing protein [Paenibacillus graminis]
MSGQKRSKRSIHTYSSKAAAAILAGTMVFGGAGAAFAATAAPAATSGANNGSAPTASAGIFTDVKNGFWAEKHIYKLASQGIVVGNNGLFRPGDSITQQEAVLMALRFMKLQGNVQSDSDVVFPTDFKVTNYYKPYVVLAFQQGLLDKAVEMAPDNLKTSWGERKASREWVAELLIRALGKNTEAAAVSGKPTGFADDAKVAANKRGYINAAVGLGLANGLDGNRFDPQGAVTRAQLATFFSRAEAHNTLEYDNTVKGTISAMQDGKLTLFNNGSTSVFNVTYSTAYFTSTVDTRINFSDLKPYTKVTVIGATYNAAYVEVTDPVQQVQTIEGVFAKVTPGTIWLDSPTGYDQYSYDGSTSFVDVNGAVISASSITPASKVALLRETYSGAGKLVKVQVTSGIVNKTANGTIQSVDTAAKSITFKTAEGATESYKWEDGTTLFSSQNAVLLPADLKTGAAVKYSVKDNLIRTVEVTSGVERTVQGAITELTGSTIVYKKADGTREVNLLGTSPAVIIPGVATPSIGDLVADATAGDNVQLTLNSSDQVTKIEVLSRQISQFTGATVVDYSAKTQLLTVTDSSGKAQLVKIDANTKLAYDGATTTSLANMGYRLAEGRKVDVVAAGQRALSVETSTKYDGTLTAVNVANRTITLKLANAQQVTLPYPQSVEIFGRTTSAITDVALDSAVTAVLADNQSGVSVLRANSSMQLEIATLDATANKLGVKWSGGTTVLNTYTLPMTDETGKSIKIGDLKVGDFVNITFNGSAPLSLKAVKLNSGQLTAVDAASGTFTLKDYKGGAQTFSAAGGVKIIRDGSTTTTLGSLTTADRVEVRKDSDGSTIIRVLSQLNRVFWRYESGTNEILVKRSSASDSNYRFVPGPNVYIHQGDTTLPVQSLKENDNIIMYFNNNILVEIAKQ